MSTLEETLADLKRETLPHEWKKDLIDSAMGEASDRPISRLRFGFAPKGVAAKLSWGAIAACWVAIAAMHFSTPASSGTAEIADRFGIEEEQVYLLAARIPLAGSPPSETFPNPD